MPPASSTSCPIFGAHKTGETPLSLYNFSSELPISLGSITLHGFVSTLGVANFLNVPYARISERFRPARLLDPFSMTGELDATQYGPRCPQPVDSIHILMNHMFEQLSMSQYSSEFDCLHLNIYAPPASLQIGASSQLPVFAWIHGGDSTTVTILQNSVRTLLLHIHHTTLTRTADGNHLVKRSIDLCKPIIVVAINYRLNLLGFMSSEEIIAEARDAGETPVMNQGLNDQRVALQWVQQNIGHFGGDASRVTLSGESAGAASVLYQLKGTVPLFTRAIICSCPWPSFRSLADTQKLFDRLVQAAGIKANAPYQLKLQALRRFSASQLIAMMPELSPPYAIEDPTWFVDWDLQERGPTAYWKTLPHWCREIIIGYTKDEASLFLAPAYPADLTKSEVERHLENTFRDRRMASAVLSMTQMQSAGSPLRSLVAYASHATFSSPILEIATGLSTTPSVQRHRKVYVYSIDLPDPFPGLGLDGRCPGPLNGFTWHSFGNAILFYQPACQLYQELGMTADKMSEAYICFRHGEERQPWEAFGVNGRKMSWNGTHTGLVDVGIAWKDPILQRLEDFGGRSWGEVYRQRAKFSILPVASLVRTKAIVD